MTETKKEDRANIGDWGTAFAAGELYGLNSSDALQMTNLVALPPDFRLEDLERFGALPRRKRGDYVFGVESSFCAYVNAHKSTDRSTLYAAVDAGQRPTAVCVLNDHEQHGFHAGFGDHRAVFSPPLDEDFSDWLERDNRLLPQLEFAQFVEDHVPNFLHPDGAELLEIVQDLSMTSDFKFKSTKRLQSGTVSFALQEEPRQKLGRDGVELPAELALRMPIFLRGKPLDLIARTRYRLADGKLLLGYHLDRPKEKIDEAFQTMMVDGVQVETGLALLWGTPAASGSALSSCKNLARSIVQNHK